MRHFRKRPSLYLRSALCLAVKARVYGAHQSAVAFHRAAAVAPGLSCGLHPVRSRRNALPANTAQSLCNGNAVRAGAADVLRFAVGPCNELLADGCYQVQAVVPFQGIQDAAGNAKGHLCIVRNLAWLQVQPAAADHVGNATVCVADLPVTHKFQGAAQGVANGHAVQGTTDSVKLLFVDLLHFCSSRPGIRPVITRPFWSKSV